MNKQQRTIFYSELILIANKLSKSYSWSDREAFKDEDEYRAIPKERRKTKRADNLNGKYKGLYNASASIFKAVSLLEKAIEDAKHIKD